MNEETYMRLAIRLAKKARGKTSPNPLVGAVVVKGDEVVGKGFHRQAGKPHAEVVALNDAGEKAKGGDLYVNLEPCNHYGRTPPCTRTIIDRGIKRVFVGMNDPNKAVEGGGGGCLRDNQIFVKTGVLKEECEKLNEVYIKYITEGRPFVIIKSAASLDGKIATRVGDTRWITNERSREFSHKLRSEVDGILVGIGTVLADDPRLTTRLSRRKCKDPVRVVVDSRLKIPLRARVLSSESKAGTIIAATEYADREKMRKLEELGVKVLIVDTKDDLVDLEKLMYELGKLGVTSLLIEGGAEINASSFNNGIVDKVLFFYAPKIIGGINAVSLVGGEGAERLSDATIVKDIRVRRFGDDILVEGYIS